MVLSCLSNYVPLTDRQIELIILTNGDADHLTGLIEVLKRYERAMICYDQAITANDEEGLRLEKARMLNFLEEYEEVVEWLDGLPKDQINGELLIVKGKALNNQGKDSEAIIALTNGIEMGAGEEAHILKASIFSIQGKYAEAMVCFGRKGLSAKALTSKAEIELKFEKPEALDTVEKALEKDGGWLPAWKLLGDIHLSSGEHKMAGDAYDSAIGIDEDYVWAWMGKARLYADMGKNNKAMKYLDIALEIDPDLAEAKELKIKLES